jgi:hypothetical protein
MRYFNQFLDDLPDHLFKFFEKYHIRSFECLLRFTKEDLSRKKMHQDDIHFLDALLAQYFYHLKSDDDIPLP